MKNLYLKFFLLAVLFNCFFTLSAQINKQDSNVILQKSIESDEYFTISKNPQCPGMYITLNVIGDSILTYSWDFGDGTYHNSSNNSTIHTYNEVGNYTIRLTLKNTLGNTIILQDTVYIFDNLQYSDSLRLTLNNTIVCPNQYFHYTTNTSANYLVIDFGDSTYSYNSSGYHTYSDTGTYIITMTATNQCGNDSSVSKTIIVSNDAPFSATLTLSINDSLVCPNQSFYYNGSITSGNTFLINFGDGTTTTTQSSGYHTYTNIGTYVITFTGTNVCGNDSVVSKTIIVSNNTPYLGTINLNIEVTSICPNESILYYSSTNNNSYTINFGDGTSTSTQNNGYHTYTTEGTYIVSLKATNKCGNDSTVSKTIIVSNSTPYLGYLYLVINETSVCPNQEFNYNIDAAGDNYSVNFGDGTSSIQNYGTHFYQDTGVYIVTLTATNICGNDSSISKSILVTNNTHFSDYINLDINKNEICPNQEINYNLSSYGNSLNIDFGDGTSSIQSYGYHTYQDTGIYIFIATATDFCGADSSIINTINVTNNAPYSDYIYLSVYDYEVCPNQPFEYHSNVASENTFITNFGDGTSSTQYYGEHSYSDLGIHTITLTATNVCGNDSSVSKTINVKNNLPYSGYLSLYLGSTNICPNQSFSYSSSVNSYDSLYIDFGDGTFTNTSSGTHSYADTGTYTVTLTAINSCGNDSSISKTILVTSEIPYSGYLYLNLYETEVCPNQLFNYNSSVNSNDSMYIDFGDGTISTITSGTHSYSNTGTYTVTLRAINGCGNDSSISKTILVTNSIPFTDYIDLSIYSTEICPNQNFTYNVSSSGNNFIVDFGDGNSSTLAYGSYSYSTMGTHVITLTATNECGNSASITRTILVSDDLQGNVYLNIYTTEVCPYQSFDYHADANGSILISFGDGTSSSDDWGTHTYSATGTYTITLTALNECGNSISVYETIKVNENIPVINAYIDANYSNVCPNTTINFYANASNDLSYLWNFGDGTMVSSSSSSNSHSYNTIGTYQVSVKISNYCNNDTTLYYTIYVENDLPASADFIINLYSVIICINQEVDYSISSWGNNSNYDYTIDYGDGTTGEVFLDHSYSSIGQYIVTLIGTNECGNTASSSEIITVVDNIPITNASLNVSENIICPNVEISFYTNGNDIIKRIWNFDDGTIDTNTTYSNIYHTFSSLGTYNVSVKLLNHCGNDTTLYTSVNVVDTINGSNYMYLSVSDSVVCPNQTFDYYTNYSNISEIYIDFGDGTNSTTSSGTHFYTNQGVYTISFTATNYCGNSTTITKTVRVTNNSIINYAYLNVSTNFSCPNSSIYFEAYGENIISRFWNFDDGTDTTTTSYNMEHTYSNSGTYQVSVILTDLCGADTTLFYNIEISTEIPYNDYLYLGTSEQVVCPKQNFSYYSNSSDNLLIDFGDGTTTTQQDGIHYYSIEGIYVISLTASNECGNDSTITESIIVASDMPVFESDIYLDILSSCDSKSVLFTAQNGYSSYLWNFGDGTIENGSNSISHTYNSFGSFNMTLTITNQCGSQKILYRFVNVIDFDIPPYIYYIDNQSEVCPNENAIFRAEPAAYSYSWNFGNGSNVSGNNISHSFSSTGTYIVTVTATNSCGNQSTETTTITVSQNISLNSSDFIYGDFYTEHCTNEDVMFFVTPNSYSYLWDFGDGTITTQTEEYQYFNYLLNVSYHKYSQQGIYIAKLTLSNSCGNSFTDSIQVTIKDNVPVNGGFNYDYSITYRAGDEIDFFAAGGLSYSWDFGDSSPIIDTTGIISEISHTYYNSGIYNIKVIVSNECGIADTIYNNIFIYPSESNYITSFKFLSINPNPFGVIDNDNGTIYVTVPYGTNITNLTPTITHTGVSISPLSNAAQNFTNIIYYSVIAEDGSINTYSVFIKVAPSGASNQKAITSFSFQNYNPAVVATINESAKTISATVPYGSILTNLIATFTHTGTDVIVNNVQQISGTTINDFSSSQNYTVIAENASSATYTVNVVVTGIEELREKLSINIYPNPNNGNFILSIENAGNKAISLSIFDISGRNVFNEKFVNRSVLNENINVSSLESGIYLVKISDGNKDFYKRVLINN